MADEDAAFLSMASVVMVGDGGGHRGRRTSAGSGGAEAAGRGGAARGGEGGRGGEGRDEDWCCGAEAEGVLGWIYSCGGDRKGSASSSAATVGVAGWS